MTNNFFSFLNKHLKPLIDDREECDRLVEKIQSKMDDIIEQKTRWLNTALAETKKYQMLVDHSPIGIMIVRTTKKHEVVYVNKAWLKMNQFVLSSVVDQPANNFLVCGMDSDAFCKKLWQTLEMGEILETREKCIANNGKIYDADIYALPVKNEEKEIAYYALMMRNVTGQKKFEEELSAKNQDLEKFYSLVVGRELRMAELKKELNRLKNNQN